MSNDNDKLRIHAAASARSLTARLGPTADWAYRRSLEDHEGLLETAHRYAPAVAEWSAGVREVFGRVYDPRGLQPLPAAQRSAWGAHLGATLESLPAWPELAAAGSAHRSVAAAATQELAQAVGEALGLAQLPARGGDDPEALQRQQEALQRLLEGLPPGAEANQGRDALRDLKERQQRSEARRQALAQGLQQALDRGKLGPAVAKVAQAAQQRAEAVRLLRGCGLEASPGGGGASEPIDPAILDYVGRQGASLKALLALVGRMRRAAKARQPDPRGRARQLPAGLVLGGDVRDLVGSEWALEDVDADLFLRRLLDRQCLQVERVGDEPQERGDLVVLVDRSGSMQGPRLQWARALAFASVTVAHQERRRVVLAFYGGQGDYQQVVVEPHSAEGMSAALRLLASAQAQGGTDTLGALQRATDACRLKTADVLVITDGDWPALTDAQVKKITEGGTRLFAVLLDESTPVHGATRTWSVRSSMSIDSAAEILCDVTNP